jgi:hypothetical protein
LGLLCVIKLKTFLTLLFSNFSISTYLLHLKLNMVFKFLVLVETVRFAIYSHIHMCQKNQTLSIKTIIKMTSYELLRKNHKKIYESITHQRSFHVPFTMLFFFFSPKIEIKLKCFSTVKSSKEKTYFYMYVIYILIFLIPRMNAYPISSIIISSILKIKMILL